MLARGGGARDMAHRLKRFVLIRDSDHASRVSISTVAAIKMEAGGWVCRSMSAHLSDGCEMGVMLVTPPTPVGTVNVVLLTFAPLFLRSWWFSSQIACGLLHPRERDRMPSASSAALRSETGYLESGRIAAKTLSLRAH